MKPRGFIISRKPGQLMISFMFYSSSGELVGKTKMKEIGVNSEDIAVIDISHTLAAWHKTLFILQLCKLMEAGPNLFLV